jgi:hypothetical protein
VGGSILAAFLQMQSPSFLVRVGRLSIHDARLLLNVTALALLVGVALRLMPLGSARGRLQRLRRISAHLSRADERRVVWALSAVGRRLPFATNCLIRALVAELLFADDGEPLRVTIGVRRVGALLQGHAWLERGGRIIVGEPSAADAALPQPAYTAMVSWDTRRAA